MNLRFLFSIGPAQFSVRKIDVAFQRVSSIGGMNEGYLVYKSEWMMLEQKRTGFSFCHFRVIGEHIRLLTKKSKECFPMSLNEIYPSIEVETSKTLCS